MLDGAVRWLASTGRSGQWGTEPFSAEPRRVAQVRAWTAGGGLRVAETGGVAAGAMVLGQAPPYVPPADRPELYVLLLVASRAHAGRGVGAALLRHAHAEAVQQGVTRLRVDCWAGGEGALVRYYEAAGFTAITRFTVGTWRARFWSGQWSSLGESSWRTSTPLGGDTTQYRILVARTCGAGCDRFGSRAQAVVQKFCTLLMAVTGKHPGLRVDQW
jgi:GNAT superfamily N-acetyltransferase